MKQTENRKDDVYEYSMNELSHISRQHMLRPDRPKIFCDCIMDVTMATCYQWCTMSTCHQWYTMATSQHVTVEMYLDNTSLPGSITTTRHHWDVPQQHVISDGPLATRHQWCTMATRHWDVPEQQVAIWMYHGNTTSQGYHGNLNRMCLSEISLTQETSVDEETVWSVREMDRLIEREREMEQVIERELKREMQREKKSEIGLTQETSTDEKTMWSVREMDG